MNPSTVVFSILLVIVGISLLTIFKKKSKKSKKEKFDSSVDCIKFPFLCSIEGSKAKNQYSNFRLLHSSINIKKAA